MTGSPSQRNGGTGAGRPGCRAPRGSVPLGRIAGMPLYLQSSWLIICVLVVALYGPILRRSMPELGLGAFVVAFGFCVLLGISVLLHELAHAGAARAFGWPVDRIVLSIMGGHTAFGRTHPRWWASTVVSIVGPIVNLLIAAVGFALLPSLQDILPSYVSMLIVAVPLALAWRWWARRGFDPLPSSDPRADPLKTAV